MNKLLLTLTGLSIAVVGSAQVHSISYPAHWLIPTSNLPKAGENLRTMHTNYIINTAPKSPSTGPNVDLHGPNPFQSGIFGYHPADVLGAYNIPANLGQGAIAIVDAFHSNFTISDFNKFCNQFGLAPETSTVETSMANKVLTVVYASGSKPAEDAGWAGEIALDTQWAHSVAPKAKIYLVLAQDNSFAALDQAVNVAANLPGVHQVSMSFGAAVESAGEQSEDSVYTHPGVTYFGATGDQPWMHGYPSASPNVVAVGGTTINIFNQKVTSETCWAFAGAGTSTIVPRPSYQNGVQSVVGNFRGNPDMSAIADPETGVAVYETYSNGWLVVGGTSLATPVCAAIANLRGDWKASSPIELTRQYGLIGQSKFVRDVTLGSIVVIDPTKGTASGVVLRAGIGYDLTTGIGEPVGVFPPPFSNTFGVVSLANPFGTVQGGSVASLTSSDGITYNIQSKLLSGTGQVASTEAWWKFTIPAGITLNTGTLNVSALVNTAGVGATNQIYLYNWNTKVYDYVGAFPLFATTFNSTSSHSGTFNIDLTKYVKSDGTFHVLTRAILPQRLGTAPFLYKLDSASVAVVGSNNN